MDLSYLKPYGGNCSILPVMSQSRYLMALFIGRGLRPTATQGAMAVKLMMGTSLLHFDPGGLASGQ